MIWTDLKRIIRAGILNFSRVSVVSLSSVFIFTITLFVIGSLILLNALLNYSLEQIKSKVDVNVYFTVSAPEETVLAIEGALEKLPEVAKVDYTSREVALENFKERHSADYLIIQSLDELGDNPLGATLNIRAKDPTQYESIVNFLEGGSEIVKSNSSYIDKINYHQNKAVIDRLNKIIAGTKKVGFAVTLALVIISILITFNTIRLAIYISREEIGIMRLVGAGNHYIRGPFLIEGVLYGIISAVVTMIIFWPITVWLGRTTTMFFGGINLFNYYLSYFFEIFGVLLISGVFLGAVSSFLAVRKYLK
ncbi:MAG: permease-like cell division protein FtsX [Candidatus Paceibacterota bacterium]|jgi:cell division transport system permease protein